MLDLKALINKLVNTPLVVASGTSGDWTYRKYSDGTYDAWQTDNPSIARSTSYGNIYRSAERTVSLPSWNNGAYVVNANVNGGEWIAFNTFSTTGGNGGGYFTYYILRQASASAASRLVKIAVHGNWA